VGSLEDDVGRGGVTGVVHREAVHPQPEGIEVSRGCIVFDQQDADRATPSHDGQMLQRVGSILAT
jgi:hypothetical protein